MCVCVWTCSLWLCVMELIIVFLRLQFNNESKLLILLRISSYTLNSFPENSPYFTNQWCIYWVSVCYTEAGDVQIDPGTTLTLRELSEIGDAEQTCVELCFNICRVLDVSIISWLNLSKLNTAARPGSSVYISWSRCWWAQRDIIWPTFSIKRAYVDG